MKQQPLSSTEQRLLELMPKNGKRINSEELATKFYKGKERPFHARLIITGTMRGLIEKLSYNKSNIKLHKSARRGQKPNEYWIST